MRKKYYLKALLAAACGLLTFGLTSCDDEGFGSGGSGLNANSGSSNPQESSGGNSRPIPSGELITTVTVDSAFLSTYSDNRAYDVLVWVPNAIDPLALEVVAGAPLYQYGISLENARSLLENSFAVTQSELEEPVPAETLISWRSYPIRTGDNIVFGLEWVRGKSNSQIEPFENRYSQNPL